MRQSKYLFPFARSFTYTIYDKIPEEERSSKEELSRRQILKLHENTKKEMKQSKKALNQIKAPSFKDLGETLMNVNYRIEYPQNLTDDQKKKMKRFDVFRFK